MNEDIVKRLLRDIAPSMKEAVCPVSLLREVAAEIERLRAEVFSLRHAVGVQLLKAGYLKSELQPEIAAAGGMKKPRPGEAGARAGRERG